MAKETILNRAGSSAIELHFAFCFKVRNRCFNLSSEISMAKIEEPKVTPERLMQFGSAYAPPLIIGAAVANKVFDTPQAERRTLKK